MEIIDIYAYRSRKKERERKEGETLREEAEEPVMALHRRRLKKAVGSGVNDIEDLPLFFFSFLYPLFFVLFLFFTLYIYIGFYPYFFFLYREFSHTTLSQLFIFIFMHFN